MSSELFSLNPAVTTDRPVGFGTPVNTLSKATSPDTDKIQPENNKTQADIVTKLPISTSQQAEVIKLGQEIKEAKEASEETSIASMSASELRETLDEINSALYSYNRSLRFELFEDTKDLVVKVFNTKTDEVIRQYPSEEVLQRKAKLLAGDTNFFSTQVS